MGHSVEVIVTHNIATVQTSSFTVSGISFIIIMCAANEVSIAKVQVHLEKYSTRSVFLAKSH